MADLREWFRRTRMYRWIAAKPVQLKSRPPIPYVPSSRPELETTRRRLDRASKRVLRLIDLELEAVTRE